MNKKEKIKKLKSKKGITLIALVVTIIVLIILAGVSINLVLGDNGIITKTKEAKENTELAKIEEEVQLNETVDYLENVDIKPGESGYQGGNYDDPYIPIGFSHIEGTWNGGYTIKDELGNEFVWVPCVLEQSKVKEKDKVVTFGRILPTVKDDGTIDVNDPYYRYNNSNFTIVGEENLASDIKTSVGKYGGFYIAKYKAGVPLDENGNEIETTSATALQKARSVAEATVWTHITRTNAITAAENMIDTSAKVKSGLISGECWDTTLQWMVNTSDYATKNTGYDIDSTGNGWYEQVNKTTTGKYPINNIYDMAGNVWEWTTENYTLNGTNYLSIRAGDYNRLGSEYPASHRGGHIDSEHYGITFRVVLYK